MSDNKESVCDDNVLRSSEEWFSSEKDAVKSTKEHIILIEKGVD